MTSIAYTNLRKEPRMDVLPRWVELVRSDKKRAARMTANDLKAEVLRRKLVGHSPTVMERLRWDWKRKGWLPFDRRVIRAKAGFRWPELPF